MLYDVLPKNRMKNKPVGSFDQLKWSSGKEERDKILSNLRNLKGIPEYKNTRVTEDYTIT